VLKKVQGSRSLKTIIGGAVSEQACPAIADKPRDAKPCQRLLQFDVKASYRQLINLFEVTEILC